MILIQGAMDVETCEYESALESCEVSDIGGYTFARGNIRHMRVAVLRTGIGTINTAASTALAVKALKPALVINQGVAGGHDPRLHKGDIVAAKRVVPIACYESPYRAAGEGVDPFAWQPLETRGDGVCVDPELVKCFTGAIPGVIGSGDAWNREVDYIMHLNKTLGTSCEEMEGIAAARICEREKIPFAAVRILSNHELHGEEYDRETGRVLQRYILSRLPALWDYVATLPR